METAEPGSLDDRLRLQRTRQLAEEQRAALRRPRRALRVAGRPAARSGEGGPAAGPAAAGPFGAALTAQRRYQDIPTRLLPQAPVEGQLTTHPARRGVPAPALPRPVARLHAPPPAARDAAPAPPR